MMISHSKKQVMDNKKRSGSQPLFPLLFLFAACVLLLAHCKTMKNKNLEFPPGVVVFSFDDGPNASENTTLRLLEVLEKYKIRSCFTLLGINAERHPDLVKRIAEGGHRIINHGYGEKWSVFMNNETFINNLLEGERAIYAAFEPDAAARSPEKQQVFDIPMYRPHGAFYKKGQQQLWEKQGYYLAPCSVFVQDAVLSEKDREKIINRIMKKIEKQNGGIILLHDARDSYTAMEAKTAKKPRSEFNRAWIPGMVEEIIIILQEKNYRISGFDPIEIPGVLSSTRSIP